MNTPRNSIKLANTDLSIPLFSSLVSIVCRGLVSFRERIQVYVYPLTSRGRALNKQTSGLSRGLWEFALHVVSNSIRFPGLRIVACK